MDALKQTNRRGASFAWIFCIGMLYSGYLIIRYRGLWAENDTAIFTHDALLTAHYHAIRFPTQYSHGFAYQLWLAIMQLTTHWSAGFINTTILPFIGMAIVLMLAFVTYIELTEHLAVSKLAAFLILLVPDITFTVLRGNHEKLTVALLLVSVLTLTRFLKAQDLKERHWWEVGFYLTVVINGTVNDYFTVMIIWGMVAYLVIAGLFCWRTGSPRPKTLLTLMRLLLVSLLIISVDVWVLFPPAHVDVHLIVKTFNKVQDLFTSQKASSNPLSAPVQQWVSVPMFLLISAFRWIAAIGSFIVWTIIVAVPFWRRIPLSASSLIMVSMYAATAMLVVAAIPVDLSGLAAGSNLEARNFTYFILFALPFVALGISRVMPSSRARQYIKLGYLTLAGTLISVFLIMSLLKATLDPIISNEWMLFSPSEKEAVLFYLNHRQNSQTLWAGPDDRLLDAAVTWWPGLNPWHMLGGGVPSLPVDALWLRSTNIAIDSIELKDTLPDFNRQNFIYQDGTTKIYAAIPTTPFEVHP